MNKKIDDQILEMINRYDNYAVSRFRYLELGDEHPSVVDADWDNFKESYEVLCGMITDLENGENIHETK